MAYGDLLMAGQGWKDRLAFESASDVESERRTKSGKWGGWGRTLGLLGTTALIAATGGMAALPAAMLIGAGGVAGRSAGRAMAGGRERDSDKSVDALFYQGQQRKFKKEIGDYQAGMRERMLTDAGKDAFSAYTMQKYFKPAMGKMKGQFIGRFGSPEQKLAMMTGDPGAADMIARAKGASEGIASLEGMHGETAFSKADPSTWGRTPAASTLGPMLDPGVVNPVGTYGVDPVQQFGTDPLGATNVDDPLSNVPSPYRPTVPPSDTYEAAVRRATSNIPQQHMGGEQYLNETVRQSLGIPTAVQDQMGGLNYEQWMGQSDEALESYLTGSQSQGQQGNLFNLIQNKVNAPANWNRPGTGVGQQPAWW